MCNFSPCIEQVQRACLKMEELKFQNIFTIECLSRKYESNHRGYMELIAKEDDKQEEKDVQPFDEIVI